MTKETHKTKSGKTAKKGLWYNIAQKKKKGKKMRKKGAKGAPTEAAIKRSQSQGECMKKSTKKPTMADVAGKKGENKKALNKGKFKKLVGNEKFKKIKAGAKDFQTGVIAGLKNPIGAPIAVIKKLIKKKKDKKKANIRDNAKKKG